MREMNSNQLFEMALGLGAQWKVAGCRFEGSPKKLELKIEAQGGMHWKCPQCERCGPVHDRVEKRWRHLNFFEYETELVARVPRCRCEEHGVRQIEVPWARAGSGFTLMFEALTMLLCEQMPVSDVAELVGEEDTRLWRIVCAYVEKAQADRDWSKVRRVLVDETSSRRGHRYVTNFVDEQTGELLLMLEGRKGAVFEAFLGALREHGGSSEAIEWIGMDMSAAYQSGAREHFPKARVVFDHFHVMALAGEALDEVRRELQRENVEIKGARWAVLGNEWTRSEEQQEARRHLMRAYPKLGRAMGLREGLQDVLSARSEEGLKWWLGWAVRSRLEAFKRVGRTLRKHLHGILGFFESGITSAAIEAMNGKIQLAKRMAKGFRNFTYFRTISYLKAAKLEFNLPPLKPA